MPVFKTVSNDQETYLCFSIIHAFMSLAKSIHIGERHYLQMLRTLLVQLSKCHLASIQPSQLPKNRSTRQLTQTSEGSQAITKGKDKPF